MQKANRNSRSRTGGWRRKTAAVVALLAVCAVMAGGTLAWQDYKQHKSNELGGTKLKYEARLVEDFEEVPDWKVGGCDVKKEIRAANFGQAAQGYGAVYVRVQLKEFMQIGEITYVETEQRYMIDTEGQFLTYAGETTARNAWPGHNVAQLTDYVTGRTGWFIETQDHDPNGQMGKHVLLNVIAGEAQPVIPGSTLAVNKNHHGYYDAAGNFVTRGDECDYPVHGWGSVDATGAIDRYVQWILGSGVILMSQWNGMPVRAWILDDSADGDGWAYWGQALATDGDTTSNLLEAVRLIEQPDGNFYYVIHTEMELLSIDEFTNGGGGEGWKVKPKGGNPGPGNVSVTGVTLNKNVLALAPGETDKLTATVNPANAGNKAVTWTSSNPAVATVDAIGNVTAVGVGTATITVTTADGGKTANCAVTVAIPSDPSIPVKGEEFSVQGSETEADNYAFVGAIDLGDFDHPQMVWQPGSVKLSAILPDTFNLSGLSVTAVPEALNGYVTIGEDKDNDPAILITYYGTKAQWETAIANQTSPAIQMTLVLHKAGCQDAAIKVNLSFEGSNIS